MTKTIFNVNINLINKSSINILLHVCCAPCALSPIPEFINNNINFSVFFYNPNIYDETEYNKRLNEVEKISKIFNFNIFKGKYDYNLFLEYIKGLENLPEGSNRCYKCFELRLNHTFQFALNNNFKFIATTLSTSPHKNIQKINEIGENLMQKYNNEITFLKFDFKKNNGFQKSVEYCKKFLVYRQNYCGCHFSKKN